MSLQCQRIEFNSEQTEATLVVDKKIYSKAAILRVCYWFSRELYFQLNEEADSFRVVVGLRVITPSLIHPQVKKIDEWMPEILNSLVDSQLRVEIQTETAAIRELIIAKAFAESGVLEDLPPGTFDEAGNVVEGKRSNLIKIDVKSTE